MTADHSLVGELVRAGRLSTEEAEQHPHRSVITRAVGTEPSVDVETLTLEASPGDLYLVCSDGLTDIVRDEEIAELILAAGKEPDTAAESLVAAANRNGGIDNITVVLFEIVEGDPVGPEDGARMAESDAEEVEEPGEDTLERSPSRARAGGAREPLRRRARRALARARWPSCSSWPPRPSSSGGASLDERPQPRAPEPRLRLDRGLRRVRERLHRRHRPRHRPLARVRRRHFRPLPRRARRRPLHRPLRRPDPAAARGAPDGARADGDLPSRPGGRAPAGGLGRRRDRRARRHADLASLRLPDPGALQVPLRDLGRRPAAPAVGAGPRAPRQRREALDQGRPDAVPAG